MKKIALVAVLVCGLAVAVSAATTEALKLDYESAVKLALANNLSLKEARKDYDEATYVLWQARGARFGKINLVYEYARLDKPIEMSVPSITLPLSPRGYTITLPPFELSPQDVRHFELQAGLPIFTGGKISAAIEQAQEAAAAKGEIYNDTINQVAELAGEQYLAVVLAREAKKANDEILLSYRQHLAQANSCYDHGLVARYDVIKAETAVKEQEKRVMEAANRYELSLLVLKDTLQVMSGQPLDITGYFFLPAVDQPLAFYTEAAERKNPLLLAAGHKNKALSAGVRRAAADFLPQVTAIGKYELDDSALPITDPKWVAGFNASLPLFDGLTNYSQFKEKQAAADRAALSETGARNQIELAVSSAYLDVQMGRSSLAQSENALSLATEGLRLADQRFTVGVGTGVEVMDANASLLAAKVGVIQSYYLLDCGYLRLQRFVGGNMAELNKRS
jgi:outer membrane protein